MPSVGEALLDYLQQARPKTAAREVFVRIPAPHVQLRMGSSLYPLIQRLLGKAGITLEGKRGPHTFRHARAVSLLRAAVPLKAIGDILGHRSAASTRPYLKLATEDLRAIGLEVPKGVKPWKIGVILTERSCVVTYGRSDCGVVVLSGAC
jgi:integrase